MGKCVAQTNYHQDNWDHQIDFKQESIQGNDI